MPKASRHSPVGHCHEMQLPLWPEAGGAIDNQAACWMSDLVDKWNCPRVEVRLISKWTSAVGWEVGWFARLDGALDEWHPSAPAAHRRINNFPWYRLDILPSSTQLAVASSVAGRAVKIVLAQMLEYASDVAGANAAREISERIESQARSWLLNE